MHELPEHVRRNRAVWDDWARTYIVSGEANWARDTPTWGIGEVPEPQVGMLPPDLAGTDAIEPGCGTGYVSAWLARRGARVVGIDNSEAQLATAVGSTVAMRSSVEGSEARVIVAARHRTPACSRRAARAADAGR